MNQEPLKKHSGEQRINLEKTSLEGQIGQSKRDLVQQQQTNQNSTSNTNSVNNIIQNDSNNKALAVILTTHLLFLYLLPS